MNQQHLDHDYYTDVITFDESRPPLVNGDVFISVDRVRDNAMENGENELSELYRVMAHGLLHLIGYGDKSTEEVATMRNKERQALRLMH
jgi:rRNA maturation RNase YbeY